MQKKMLQKNSTVMLLIHLDQYLRWRILGKFNADAMGRTRDTIRQIQKSIQNAVGEFHEYILGFCSWMVEASKWRHC